MYRVGPLGRFSTPSLQRFFDSRPSPLRRSRLFENPTLLVDSPPGTVDPASERGYQREWIQHEGYQNEGIRHEGYQREEIQHEGNQNEGYQREGIQHEGNQNEGYQREGNERGGIERGESSMTSENENQAKIALIVCSTRSPRVGPDISSWVSSTIKGAASPRATLTTLDLASFPLPLSPRGIPLPAQQQLPLPATPYEDSAVNAWSQEVRKYSAFIFVTPQYNWSFPAALKCAIDHLFHEWVGKPALIVSYGSRGGSKATAQLREVLLGLRMDPWAGKVELALADGVQQAINGVLSDSVAEAWQEGGKAKELLERWDELVALVVDRDRS